MTLLLEHFDTLLTTPADVDALNRAILTLAVQGKLVPQDADDEPASKLLKRIQSAKGVKTENLHIKESEKPYKLPKGWEWIRFGEVTINRDGERIPVSKEEREIRNGDFDYYGASGVIDKIDKFLFDKPLLLIGEDGANLINRSTPIAFIANGKYWVNNHAHVLDAIDFGILKYLEIYINAIDLKPYITGTAQPKMNQAKMNSIVLALPPLAEQKRIVARVDALFAQTRVLAAKLARSESDQTHLNQSALHHLLSANSLEEFEKQWDFLAANFDNLFTRPEHIAPLRQSILELAVRGKLTRREVGDESAKELLKRIKVEKEKLGKVESLSAVKESEKLFAVPKEWEWTRLGSIANIGTGSTPLRSNPDYYINGTIPWATSSATNSPFISKTDELITEDAARDTRLRIYPKHTLVVALYGQGKTRGQVSELLIDSTINQACASVAFIGESENLRAYTKLFLLKNYREMRLLAEGGAQPNLNLNKIKQMTVPIPPLAEQARIVARVEQLLGLCDALESRLQAAGAERGRLVHSVLGNLL